MRVAPAASFLTLALLLLLLPAAACGPARPPEPEAGAEEGSASRILEEAMDEVWEHTLADSIFLRLKHGLPIEHLPDLSFEKAREDAEQARSILGRLAGVDPAALTHQDHLSLLILRWNLEMQVEGLDFFWHTSPVTPYATPLRFVHEAFARHVFTGPEDAERYLRLAGQYPRLIRQIEEHLDHQLKAGLVLPRPEIELVARMLEAYIRPPEESLFLPAAERLGELEAEAAQELRAGVLAVVGGEINPALRSLLAFLQGPYAAAAPETVGLWQVPGGEDYYRYLVRLHTSLEVTPEEVHEMGRREVARLEEAMTRQRRELGWEEAPGPAHRRLRRDPRFLASSAQEVGEHLRRYVALMEPRLDELFARRPQAPYGIARLDPALEGGMTYGYYQPPTVADPRGTYFFNGSHLEDRSLLGAQSLIYHELVPGHHFQLALQYENEDLHPLRREAVPTAFVEGWAEYASSLGEELGLYRTPEDLYGRRAAEMFLSVRLVVDTGMNALGWSRQQAMDLMARQTLESEVQIATETLRYSADIPGQALAYKVGALEIRRLRRKAEAALGDDFDLRAFHGAVLGSGAMPLVVLETHIDAFIEEQLAAARGGAPPR